MTRASSTTAPAKPRKPRTKREPSELSLAIKSVNLLKRKQAAHEKLESKLDELDVQIADLQTTAAFNMKAVNDLIYGPDPAPTGA